MCYGSQKLSAIPSGDRQSFYLSDLVIETHTEDGKTCYIAVEASYTCEDSDVKRAVKHAQLLTKFTQEWAFSVIAGVRIDERIQGMIDAEEVFWYPLRENDLFS